MKRIFRLALYLSLALAFWFTTHANSGQAQQPADPAPSYGEQIAQSHAGDLPVPTEAIAEAPRLPVDAGSVIYGQIDGTELTGYLAYPSDRPAELPGLIVIHEWWGLNDNIEAMTERLAGEGYAALAVDLYEGETAEDRDRARELVQVAIDNPERLQENIRQAYAYLETEQQAPRIGSIGWCFGGSWSLNTALLFPEDLDATVIYYGGQLVTDPEQLATLQMPILGLFGAIDDNPSVETVQTFESVLQDLGKSVEIHIYEGADHAFANSSGTRYNPDAAEAAWDETTEFLAEHLQ